MARMSAAEVPFSIRPADDHIEHAVDHLLAGAAVPVSNEVATGLIREWDRLAGPGPTLTARARVAAARSARRALNNPGTVPVTAWSAPNILAAHVAVDSAGITEGIFNSFLTPKLTPEMRAEIVGVAARITAIDRFTLGVGTGLLPLPKPFSGKPTGMVLDASEVTDPSSTVPALCLLDQLPTEQHAARDLAETLYGRPMDHTRRNAQDASADDLGLSAAQAGVVAARTAWLVECDVNLLIHARALRRSVLNHEALHLAALQSTDPTCDPGVANGSELISLTDCLANNDRAGMKKSRAALSIATSSRTTADAVGVAASEHLLSRLANTARIPRPAGLEASAWALGFEMEDAP